MLYHPRIILLFDANKLDISDEFRRSIEAIHGYEDKVRIVLNKADQVTLRTPPAILRCSRNEPFTESTYWADSVYKLQCLCDVLSL